MRKFDTKVQHLKYKVLREVARLAWDDALLENAIDIPKRLAPGKQPTVRCCVYKERAILGERVKLAICKNKYVINNIGTDLDVFLFPNALVPDKTFAKLIAEIIAFEIWIYRLVFKAVKLQNVRHHIGKAVRCVAYCPCVFYALFIG